MCLFLLLADGFRRDEHGVLGEGDSGSYGRQQPSHRGGGFECGRGKCEDLARYGAEARPGNVRAISVQGHVRPGVGGVPGVNPGGEGDRRRRDADDRRG